MTWREEMRQGWYDGINDALENPDAHPRTEKAANVLLAPYFTWVNWRQYRYAKRLERIFNPKGRRP